MTDHVAYENRKQNQAREKLGVKLGSNASYVKGHRAMNDDVKDALELARSSAASKCQCLDCRALRALIPHIDGEPARLAAAREEQREACARHVMVELIRAGWDGAAQKTIPQHTRSTPLTATPLADEIAALRAQVEAARTYARQSLDYGEDCDAHDLLKAMDEAKP